MESSERHLSIVAAGRRRHFHFDLPDLDVVFPGLWLDGAALLAGDMVRVLAKLDEGLRSPEHQTFVAKLARNRQA